MTSFHERVYSSLSLIFFTSRTIYVRCTWGVQIVDNKSPQLPLDLPSSFLFWTCPTTLIRPLRLHFLFLANLSSAPHMLFCRLRNRKTFLLKKWIALLYSQVFSQYSLLDLPVSLKTVRITSQAFWKIFTSFFQYLFDKIVRLYLVSIMPAYKIPSWVLRESTRPGLLIGSLI